MLIAPSLLSLCVPPVECLAFTTPGCPAALMLSPAAAPDPVAAPSLVISSIPEAPSTTVPLAPVFVQTSKNRGENSVKSHGVILFSFLFFTGL